MKAARKRLKTEISPADADAIVALFRAGAPLAAAALQVGVRPSSLRAAKKCDPALRNRLRAAWEAQRVWKRGPLPQETTP